MARNKYKAGDKVTVYLPDGNLIKAKIVETVPSDNYNYYLVQFNNTYALVAERDIIKKN
ncbi:MAG: hypothetical protein HPY89_03475 [Pelotomaculum sp.]|uniref:RND related beta-barrel domain-containing protein n=1 Tax=Pelotomaculum thermopropionicum (strain DSM 13744 / JCM 10971 / SI) TaxID=370438 RepID=A5D3T1_PELTS|nr:hypothetical protein [Pelotomaculum sp.]BAF59104.1 hypothetical protein PTH_0923 [Pelotomaculum thermopropionicum SI]